MDRFISLNTFSSSDTNTDQLSASLKTDKTGVWHWNSSQTIKDPFCLPPYSVTLHFHCDTTPCRAFKHWGAWLPNRQLNVQIYVRYTDIKTMLKEQKGLKRRGSEVIIQLHDAQAVHHTTYSLWRNSWTFSEIRLFTFLSRVRWENWYRCRVYH